MLTFLVIKADLPQPFSPSLRSQLLAVHLRREVARGALCAISPLDGTHIPPSPQHAEDTTIYLRTRADIRAALAGSVH
jgi:hypothetical protein